MKQVRSKFAKRRAAPLALCLSMAEIILLCTAFSRAVPLLAKGPDAAAAKLERTYRQGEEIAYTMQAINQGPTSTIRYVATAEGRVKRDESGHFLEEFAWTSLSLNGEAFPLSSASRQFREYLSLSPEYRLSVPDLSKVQPVLIGPITDLLTFYADVQLAMRQQGLSHVGDHVYIRHGTPNSWADGRHTLLGQDAVDFDITLSGMDVTNHIVTLVVRHVPPAQLRIPLPAAWMSTPVDRSPNNWVQVQRADDGSYIAEIGQETFDDRIKLNLLSGKILSAEMENPVNVVERSCKDAALSSCGPSTRYRIKRQIIVQARTPQH